MHPYQVERENNGHNRTSASDHQPQIVEIQMAYYDLLRRNYEILA